MKAYRIKLPFPRQIDNVSEDVSYETIQEICEGLDIHPVEIPNDNINFVNLEAINFVGNDDLINNVDYILYVDDDGFQYIYEYNSSPAIVSRNDGTVMQTHTFVLSNWYTFEVYMFRNNLSDKSLRIYAWNAHANRWIYDESALTYKLYPDYLRQFYLLSPNTTVITKNVHEKQLISEDMPDSSLCNFLWDTTLHIYYEGSDNFRDKISTALRTSYSSMPGNDSIEMKWGCNWNWSPWEDVGHTLHNNTTNKDALACLFGEKVDGVFAAWGSVMPKVWADTWDGTQHNITWDMVDDLYANVDNMGRKSWRYALFPLATQLQSATWWQGESGLNQIWTEYWVNGNNEQIQLPGVANQGFVLLLPVVDKEIEFYQKHSAYNSSGDYMISDSGNIKTVRIDSLQAWQTLWTDMTTNYNTAPTSIISYVKPSMIYKKYLSDSTRLGAVNWLNNYYDGTQIRGAMHNIGCYGYLGNADDTDLNEDAGYMAGILNYFLLDMSQATAIFTDLQDTNLKFFSDFKSYLKNINGISGFARDISIKSDNEPIVKSPIYFNLRYGIENTGSGTISADMIDWQTVEEEQTHVNINSLETDRTLYCWDITTCVNPLFDFTATMEQLQFADNRQYVNTTAWTAYQNTAYTAMASQFDTSKTQTWLSAANSMIGTGLTFLDGMNYMGTGNQYAGMATAQAVETSKGLVAQLGSGMGGAGIGTTGLSMAGSLAGGLMGCMNAALVSKNINNQRAAMLSAPTASTNLPFAASVLPATEPYFWTSYMLPNYQQTLTNYHNWWGYIHYTEMNFADLWNRIHYNYIKLDSDWNKKWITDSAVSGDNKIPATFKQLPYVELYLKRLQDGLRVHKVLSEEIYYNDAPHTKGKLWTSIDRNNLEIEYIELLNMYNLLGDYTDWIINVHRYTLIGDYSVWLIDIPETSPLLIEDVEENKYIIVEYVFSDDFTLLRTPGYTYAWHVISEGFNLVVYHQDNDTDAHISVAINGDSHTLWDLQNGWYPSQTIGNGSTWNLETKTLSIVEPQECTTNDIYRERNTWATAHTGTLTAWVYTTTT